ncbi:helix-turn-helix domain-containing protein [Hafnia paralvei]|uniref:helix-turn-helix domain-containing protein n=1 Tax=Hafnia paralvei TaxID=546367 RepID=UPI0010345CAD|nr:helix-turn-helix domain-containing protein [Hafnia paralvei]TBL56446.1 helix-turn-helix domain-containing protein [Hafnia paralvei]
MKTVIKEHDDTQSHIDDFHLARQREIAVIGTLVGIDSDELGEEVKCWILQSLIRIKNDYISESLHSKYNDHSLQKPLHAPFNNDLTLGPRIHDMRELRELNHLELGEMIGVSRSCVEAWEDGTTVPGCNHLVPLANALNCDPLWLLTGESQIHQGAKGE